MCVLLRERVKECRTQDPDRKKGCTLCASSETLEMTGKQPFLCQIRSSRYQRDKSRVIGSDIDGTPSRAEVFEVEHVSASLKASQET